MTLYELVANYINSGTEIVVQDYMTNTYFFEGKAGELQDGDYILDYEVAEIAPDPNYPDVLNILVKE